MDGFFLHLTCGEVTMYPEQEPETGDGRLGETFACVMAQISLAF